MIAMLGTGWQRVCETPACRPPGWRLIVAEAGDLYRYAGPQARLSYVERRRPELTPRARRHTQCTPLVTGASSHARKTPSTSNPVAWQPADIYAR